MRALEAGVCSLSSRLVGSGDQIVLFEDFVYGAAAYLDVFLLVEPVHLKVSLRRMGSRKSLCDNGLRSRPP